MRMKLFQEYFTRVMPVVNLNGEAIGNGKVTQLHEIQEVLHIILRMKVQFL